MAFQIKISNITNLQDARYSAAVGFHYISFSLERGSTKKLAATMIWNMVNWLEGIETVLELNAESLEELDEFKEVSFRYITLPIEDWSIQLPATLPQALILRADAAQYDVAALQAIITEVEASNREVKIELSVDDAEQLAAYQSLAPYIMAHFPSIEIAQAFAQTNEAAIWAISFREEAEEEPGLFDYEKLDEFVETIGLEL